MPTSPQDDGKVAKVPRDKVLAQVKKMQRALELGEQANMSESEAQTMASIMARLVTEHKIEMSELEMLEQDKVDPVGLEHIPKPLYDEYGVEIKKRRIFWMEELADMVGRSHYCYSYVIPGLSRTALMGRRSDRETAARTYLYLARMAERIADREYVKYFYEAKARGKVEEARGFREQFLRGFVSRIGHRLSMLKLELEREYASSGLALVRIKSAWDAVDAYKADREEGQTKRRAKPASTIGRTRKSNSEGRKRGERMADQVSLDRDPEPKGRVEG